MPPKMRKDFNPCAVWLPGLTTDAEGKFTATFTNPDTLTRYRVIAVALHGKDKFGSATTDYTVDKPLMLEPTAPRYASEGDQLNPKVLVQNNSDIEGTWEISLATTSVTRTPQGMRDTKTVTLRPGGQSTVYFDVTFTGTGTATWTWSAEPVEIKGGQQLTPVLARDLSDIAETKFEVTYPVPLMRQVKFVSMKNNGQHNLLQGLKPELLDGRGHIDVETDAATSTSISQTHSCLRPPAPSTTSSTTPTAALSRQPPP